MNNLVYQILASRKRRLAARIGHDHRPSEVPLLAASNIQYELSARDRGIACGGIGAVHLLARRIGLIDALDRQLHLLKIHLPYHESDHVLNLAYNVLAGGECLEDLELLRQDEVFLDALSLPETRGRWREIHRQQKQQLVRMEFKRFLHALILRPCQIIKTSRRIICRLLSWNPWQGVFLRLVETLRRPMLR